MKRVALVLLLTAFSGGVMAAEIPDVDIDTLCAKRATQDKYSVMGCKVVEGSSFIKLRNKWGIIPDKVAEFCLRGTTGYGELNICLDEALKRLPGAGVSLEEGLREVRYWTHAECMEARKGGGGVCVTH